MRTLGNKVAARNLAMAANVPVVPATEPLPTDIEDCLPLAHEIGYPVMLKASWGGGGRGMRVDRERSAARASCLPGQARGQGRVRQGRGLSRKAGRARAPRRGADPRRQPRQPRASVRARLLGAAAQPEGGGARAGAVSRASAARRAVRRGARDRRARPNYRGAGTVEFLLDADTGKFYFIEVNPRIQVEHTVTEWSPASTSSRRRSASPKARASARRERRAAAGGHPPQRPRLQCRITTEDPEQNFIPDYGRITAYRSATGFGMRLDGGTAYSGAVITRFYDPLLEKVTAWAPTPEEAIARMHRALREFRIRGVVTNLRFLENVITHPSFANDATRRGSSTRRRSCSTGRASGTARRSCSTYIADVTVNGHPEVQRPAAAGAARSSRACRSAALQPPTPPGTKQMLDELGPEELRAVDAGAEARAVHRHHDARRAPVAARHAHAQLST